MKAYRTDDGEICMFRPDKNMQRMQRSAIRSALPDFDKVCDFRGKKFITIFQAEMLECIRQLVNVDRDWVPDNQKASLYIRPTMIGTEPSLGVSVSYFSTNGFLSCFSHPQRPSALLFSAQSDHTSQLVVSTQFPSTPIPRSSALSKAVAETTKWAQTTVQLSTHTWW